MKVHLILLIAFCFSSCSGNKKASFEPGGEDKTESQINKPEWQSFIDSSEVTGSILIYDLHNDTYYSNNFEWANKGNLPASTFKIANSIIGLESGVIESDSVIFKWDREKKWLKKWEQDLVLKDAFHFSCVYCYQDVARRIGEERMNYYLRKFNYGDMKVDSSNVDKFWLEGNSRISQMQQIDFLKRFYESKLPISERTEKIIKNLIVIEDKGQYKLSGKSGLSNSNEIYNGWFVGFIELKDKTYFFATNVEPKGEFEFDSFINKRMDLTLEAFKTMKIIN